MSTKRKEKGALFQVQGVTDNPFSYFQNPFTYFETDYFSPIMRTLFETKGRMIQELQLKSSECFEFPKNILSTLAKLKKLNIDIRLKIDWNFPNRLELLKLLYDTKFDNCSSTHAFVIGNFGKITDLKELEIEDAQIENLECLVSKNLFKDLEKLNFMRVKVNSFPRPSLRNLKVLKFDRVFNSNSWANLSELIYLNDLTIIDDAVVSMSIIEELVNLKILNLISCTIRRIFGLKNLRNLVTLDLSNNCITEIENLSYLTNLKKLNLSYNAIPKVQNLDNLKNLAGLKLAHNAISRVEKLNSLVKLVELDLTFNSIKSIIGIESMGGFGTKPKLVELDLSSNFINNIENN